MSKVTLNNLNNLQNENSAVAIINSNSAAIVNAFDNTISRDGSTPNTMEAQLDMNSNRILNVPVPTESGDLIRLSDLDAFIFPTPGEGNVIGPVSAVSGNIPVFFGDSGKAIADSGSSLQTIETSLDALEEDLQEAVTSLQSSINLKANRSGDTFTGAVSVPSLTSTGAIAATTYTGSGTSLTGVETSSHASATYSPILRTILTVGSSTVSPTWSGAVLVSTSGSTQTVNIAPNSGVAIPIGAQFDFISLGTRLVFSAGSGVTLRSLNSNKAVSPNGACTLIKWAADDWFLSGALVA